MIASRRLGKEEEEEGEEEGEAWEGGGGGGGGGEGGLACIPAGCHWSEPEGREGNHREGREE